MGTIQRVFGSAGPARAALCAVLLAAGCGTSGVVGPAAAPAEDPEIPIYRRVVVDSPSLKSDVSVIDVRVAPAGDILGATVTVGARTASPLRLQYRFVWIDAKGFEVGREAGGWEGVTVPGNDAQLVHGIAPTAAAMDFMVKIRRER